MSQIYGIDLSKEKFDVNYLNAENVETHKIVKNNLKSISRFLEKLPQDALLCAEHTGIYGELLVYLANCMNISISLTPGYEIKHSLGMQKGKTDKVDAGRIREYGERFMDRLKQTQITEEPIKELRELHTLRSQLVKERKMLTTHCSEKKQSPFNSVLAHQISQRQLEALELAIEELDQEILLIVEHQEELYENYKLATSVMGIGPVTACELIIKTGNFKQIDTAPKAASYAGICPFPNASGKMVKKSKTSPLADKALKTLLHMCTKSAYTHNKELNLYYQRKKQEGKPHYLILNNISNKLLRTVYSVVKSRIPYDQNYICTDPRESEKKVA